jgi:NADH-quinone oxidoreductase subunit L
MFHLFTHAFFKALLFLGAGSVIHAMQDEQDMRKMGGLRELVPTSWIMMMVGTLALTGFPLTAGFFSKDAVIEAAYAAHAGPHMFGYVLLVVAALFTSFYSWRLIFMTFYGQARCSKETLSHVHESPPIMLVPLLVLAVGALLTGYLFSGLFIGDGQAAFWGASVFTAEDNHVLHDLHNVPLWVKLSPLVMMVSGFVLAYIMYIRDVDMPARLAQQHVLLYKFLLNKWYFDELYNFLFVRPAAWLARVFWRGGDGYIIDGFGPNGIAANVLNVTQRFVALQSGFVYHYAFVMLIGVAGFVTWFMFGGGQ